MHKYEIDIFWSAEDDRYIAVVPDLPGCLAHGRTYKEALAEAEIATSMIFAKPLRRNGLATN